ncbi:MAG: AEC family transporter [Peptoniphilaceae bacterium]|nr:AEC family transporter [Peptoniphilaceae bacterium]MDY6085359.1 AEC family transporter [Peptoniphilaceae bacterium]
MEDLIFSFQRVLPLLVYMVFGVFCHHFGIISRDFAVKLNGLVFSLFLPISLMMSSYHSALNGGALLPFTLYAIVALFVILIVNWVYYERQPIPGTQKSVMIQSSYRSNFSLFGVTLVADILNGAGTGMTEFLIAMVIPLTNVISIFVLQSHGDEQMDARSFVHTVVRNPLIHGILIGFALNLLGVTLPGAVEKPLQNLANIATPLALVALGARFSLEDSLRYRPLLIKAVSTRLLIVPFLGLTVAALLGFRGEALVAYLAFFGTPAAVASYAMAVAMNQDGELAGQILIYTSIFCSFTLFLFIFAMRHLALI